MASDEGEARLTATMCGVVQRLNKLVMVRAYKSRYAPEIGDVVVGRVDELQTRRWAVDIGSRPQSSLQLSAVDLPGGVQRRRTAEDELVMRAVFREGDVLAAEVCAPPCRAVGTAVTSGASEPTTRQSLGGACAM